MLAPGWVTLLWQDLGPPYTAAVELGSRPETLMLGNCVQKIGRDNPVFRNTD